MFNGPEYSILGIRAFLDGEKICFWPDRDADASGQVKVFLPPSLPAPQNTVLMPLSSVPTGRYGSKALPRDKFQ